MPRYSAFGCVTSHVPLHFTTATFRTVSSASTPRTAASFFAASAPPGTQRFVFVPGWSSAVFDGAFHESYFQSAPYFTLRIDGIEWINEAY